MPEPLSLQPVISAVVQLAASILMLCGPIVARQAYLWLKAKTAEADARLKQSLDAHAYAQLRNVAQMAVNSAEQFLSSAAGKERKAYALKVAQDWLASRGITLDAQAIEAAVEAEVLALDKGPVVTIERTSSPL